MITLQTLKISPGVVYAGVCGVQHPPVDNIMWLRWDLKYFGWRSGVRGGYASSFPYPGCWLRALLETFLGGLSRGGCSRVRSIVTGRIDSGRVDPTLGTQPDPTIEKFELSTSDPTRPDQAREKLTTS